MKNVEVSPEIWYDPRIHKVFPKADDKKESSERDNVPAGKRYDSGETVIRSNTPGDDWDSK